MFSYESYYLSFSVAPAVVSHCTAIRKKGRRRQAGRQQDSIIKFALERELYTHTHTLSSFSLWNIFDGFFDFEATASARLCCYLDCRCCCLCRSSERRRKRNYKSTAAAKCQLGDPDCCTDTRHCCPLPLGGACA